MQYTFYYEETLSRMVQVNARDLASALTQVHEQIDSGEITLGKSDFLSGRISAPLYDNKFTLQLENDGESIDCFKDGNNYEIILETW